jgi:hypothetical protein
VQVLDSERFGNRTAARVKAAPPRSEYSKPGGEPFARTQKRTLHETRIENRGKRGMRSACRTVFTQGA